MNNDYLSNQLKRLKSILENNPAISDEDSLAGNFTCLPMIFAINKGAGPEEMGSRELGCDGECRDCILATDNKQLDDAVNLIKTWELIDE